MWWIANLFFHYELNTYRRGTCIKQVFRCHLYRLLLWTQILCHENKKKWNASLIRQKGFWKMVIIKWTCIKNNSYSEFIYWHILLFRLNGSRFFTMIWCNRSNVVEIFIYHYLYSIFECKWHQEINKLNKLCVA